MDSGEEALDDRRGGQVKARRTKGQLRREARSSGPPPLRSWISAAYACSFERRRRYPPWRDICDIGVATLRTTIRRGRPAPYAIMLQPSRDSLSHLWCGR